MVLLLHVYTYKYISGDNIYLHQISSPIMQTLYHMYNRLHDYTTNTYYYINNNKVDNLPFRHNVNDLLFTAKRI